jgi:TonB family protein
MSGLVLPLPLQADSRNPAVASARYPGPSASRDEYCAYALSLVLRHLDLLPDSLVAARRGETFVTIRLRTDGSIMSAMVSRGSGYLDIDERVTKMVLAVGKFPPLPNWITTSVADFTFRLHFPHGPTG